jgi:ABC-type branched-subunit amino acid transport system substrate-binding protein
VNQKLTDFSSLVSKVGDDVDVVFLPRQIAANAQIFGQQLKEQGKDAVIFGSDGLFSPSDFKIDGSDVSSFAPDITNIESSADLVEAYTAEYGDFGTFGPPTYAATEAVLTAANSICQDGNEPTRDAITERLGDTTIDDSILGGSLSFDDNGDPEGAEFYIFTIDGGEYTLVDE